MNNYFKSATKKISIVLLPLFITMIFLGTTASADVASNPDFSAPILMAENTTDSVQLQWYLLGPEPTNFNKVSDKLNTYLDSKLNTTVNFNFLDISTYSDKKSLLFDAGETVDIIYTSNWLNYNEDANKGLYIPLNGLLDKYAAKTKSLLGSNVLKGIQINGKIYALPVVGYPYASASGIAFRKDLLKKYNIDVSKIKKLSDAGTALKTIKSKLPSIIPLINYNSELNYDMINSENFENNFKCPGVINSTGKDNRVYNEFEKTETKTFLKTLYDFRKAGYLKDSKYPYSDKSDGKVFAILESDMDPLSDDYGDYQWTHIYLGKPVITQTSSTSAMNAIGITSSHQAEALKVQELINTDSYLTNLLHFGIEGDDYVKVSANVIDYPENVDSTSTSYSFLNWSIGNRYLDFTWSTEDPNKYKSLKAFNDKATASRSIGFTFDTKPIKKEVSACETIWNKYVPKLLSGEYDPQKYLSKLNSELKKAGLAKILTGKQQQFEKWLKSTPNSTPAKASSGIKLNLNGEKLTLEYEPVFDNGIVLVPMNSIFKSFDAFYGYDAKTKVITASRGKSKLSMTNGSKSGYADGKATQLGAAPKTLNSQIYVPLEFVCKAFGFGYSWNKDIKTATITLNEPFPQTGNTNGNITNLGSSVSDSDYIYVSLYDNGGTFKIRKDGNGKTRLLKNPASSLNISGDWLYYINSTGTKAAEKQCIFKIKKDGSGNSMLGDSQASNLILAGDWLYYINLSDNNKPYRIGLDGKHSQKISEYPIQSFILDNGWIYFQASNDTSIYKMRTSGTDLKMLADTGRKSGSIWLNKSGDTLYYYGGDILYGGIYQVKSDGSGNKLLVSTAVSHMNCSEGYVYFSDTSGNLYKIDEANKTFTKIGSNATGNLCITDNWVYYAYYDRYGETIYTEFRVKTDGLVKQKFDASGNLTDIYKIDSAAFESKPIVLQPSTYGTTVKTAKEIVKNKSAVAYIKIYDEDGEEIASGSGFNIDSNGIVVTNFHVISDASSVKCTYDNDKTYEMDYILNYNQTKDIAIIHLKDASNLPVVNLGDSSKVELADDVLAIGNPLDFQNTISDGIISGIRTIFGIKLLQTTAAISPGSSGGPLFNAYGDVIGMTSSTYMGAQNMNFAVPINSVKNLFATSRIIPLAQINLSDNTIIDFENNNTLKDATPCGYDKTINGSISSLDDIDYYKLDVNGKTNITFSALSLDSLLSDTEKILLEISLLDSNENIVAKSVKTTEEGIDILKMTSELAPGTYYISIKSAPTCEKTDIPVSYTMLVVED